MPTQKTITKTVYTLDELEQLDNKAYERAYNWVLEGQYDHPWYEFIVDEALDKEENEYSLAAKIGVTGEHIYFDIDRGAYAYIDKPAIVDAVRFAEAADDIPSTIIEAIRCGDIDFTIFTHHFGGGHAKNKVEVTYCTIEDIDPDSIIQPQLQDVLDNTLSEILTALRNEAEYLSSREAIHEVAEINEWVFDENGKFF